MASRQWVRRRASQGYERTLERQQVGYLRRATRHGTIASKRTTYTLRIHLETPVTGRHGIVFNLQMLRNPTGTGRSRRTLPEIKREPGPPYAQLVRKGRNKEWDKLSSEIAVELKKLFARGTYLRFPSPGYPNDRRKDKVFVVHSYIWEHCRRPGCTTRNRRYTGPMAIGGYKFVIVPVDMSVPGQPAVDLVVNIAVSLRGRMLRGVHTIPQTIQVEEEAKGLVARLLRNCNDNYRAIVDIVEGMGQGGLSKQGRGFEREIERARREKEIFRRARRRTLRRSGLRHVTRRPSRRTPRYRTWRGGGRVKFRRRPYRTCRRRRKRRRKRTRSRVTKRQCKYRGRRRRRRRRTRP